jgi:NAD+ synthase
MENENREVEARVAWIQQILVTSRLEGIVVGNSGGKDSATVLALSKLATKNVVSVIMPCKSLNSDAAAAKSVAEKFEVENIKVELSKVYDLLQEEIFKAVKITNQKAYLNLKPRLRMAVLYTVAQCKHYLVAGTGNRSEIELGYFTKWGDGACDFNPIADLTVEEVRCLGTYLGVPKSIINKAPSAGLFYGQTDEGELGLKYAEIDKYLLTEVCEDLAIKAKIEAYRYGSRHKRRLPLMYPEAINPEG